MSLLSTKDLSRLTGIAVGTIRVHVTRGALQKNENGFFDTENELNKRYIEDKTRLNSQGVTVEKDKKTTSRVKEQPTGLTATQKTLNDYELRTKKAATELKERESELKKMELEKKAGNLLPVELVNRVIVLTVQTIFKSFDVGLDNMARISVDRFGGTRKDLAEIITQQRLLLSKLIDSAKENTRIEIDNAIDEYQETKK